MSRMTRDGVDLAYELRGEGPPVALAMGLGMAGAVWGPIADSLAEDHAVLTWDNRGIGASSLPDAPYSMADLGDDLARLMDHVGWKDAHVVGVSMGGMAVQEFAIRHTPRVRSLTLIATHSGNPNPSIRSVLPTPKGVLCIARSRLGTKKMRAKGWQRLLYPRDSPVQWSPSTQTMLDGATDPKHKAAVRKQLRAVFGHHTTDRLTALAGVPTQIVRPGQDLLCRPNNNDRLAATIPNSRLVRLDHAGHGIIAQCASELTELIRSHVAAVG